MSHAEQCTATLTVAVIAPATRLVTLDAIELAIGKVTSDGKPVAIHHDDHQLRSTSERRERVAVVHVSTA